MEKNDLAGGWTPYKTEISIKEKELFKTVFKGILGVDYKPLAVATQVVAGINYRFFCNVKGVYPHAANEGAIVQIYEPLDGHAHITSIHKV
jgi:hypothetical protein